MISGNEFIRQSIEQHLFFSRIMKEHSFFLQVGFLPKDQRFVRRAINLRAAFERFLSEVVSLADGVISQEAINSGDFVTPYTQEAERITSNLSGIDINTTITQMELRLASGDIIRSNPRLERKVSALNEDAIRLIDEIIDFKVEILTYVLSCRMATFNYPLLIEHILREAEHYSETIKKLQSREELINSNNIDDNEAFWNQIMGEHAEFIRGLLDPTEEELIMTANDFANEFKELTQMARQAADKAGPDLAVTAESLKATRGIREFKEAGTKGIIDCKIKSIIVPLLADHVTREANHYLRILKMLS